MIFDPGVAGARRRFPRRLWPTPPRHPTLATGTRGALRRRIRAADGTPPASQRTLQQNTLATRPRLRSLDAPGLEPRARLLATGRTPNTSPRPHAPFPRRYARSRLAPNELAPLFDSPCTPGITAACAASGPRCCRFDYIHALQTDYQPLPGDDAAILRTAPLATNPSPHSTVLLPRRRASRTTRNMTQDVTDNRSTRAAAAAV